MAISEAGRFYLDYCLFNVDYVRESIPWSNLRARIVPGYSLPDSVAALRRFLSILLHQDCLELERLISRAQCRDYVNVYGYTIFTREVIENLARRAVHILRPRDAAVLAQLPNDRRVAFEHELAEWDNYLIPAAQQQDAKYR